MLKPFRAAGKPLVVEEIFPINCSADQIEEFVALARPAVAGWVGFYWGQTPDELRRAGTSHGTLTRQWLEVFQKLNPAP